jgi:hypothetical protein
MSFPVSLQEEIKTRGFVGPDRCEIKNRKRYYGSDTCGMGWQLMKVYKCDGDGEVDHALVKLILSLLKKARE